MSDRQVFIWSVRLTAVCSRGVQQCADGDKRRQV
jgi:hypothetical protein